jgi:predicted amidohydrolase YtcJ
MCTHLAAVSEEGCCMRKSYFLIVVFFTVFSFSVQAQFEQTIILVNGRIYTVNEAQPLVEAIFIKRGKIDAIGSNEKIFKRARAGTQVLDLKGRTIVPGFIDSHVQMQALGGEKAFIDLSETTSYDEVVAKVNNQAQVTKVGQWIIGRGWNHENWDIKLPPTHDPLSALIQENPVALFNSDDSLCLINNAAMVQLEITNDTQSPEGGVIRRKFEASIVKKVGEEDTGPHSELSGILQGPAVDLVSDQLPPPTQRQILRALRLATQRCIENGVTTVHDIGISPQTVTLYKRLIDETKYLFRVYGVLDAGTIANDEEFKSLISDEPLIGYGSDRLTVRSVHVDVDGQLNDGSASLFAPYLSASPNNKRNDDTELGKGSLSIPLPTLSSYASQALGEGYQFTASASGDFANNAILTAYSVALKNNRGSNHRLRVEHVEMIRQNDVAWMAEMNVLASIHPYQVSTDYSWLEKSLGAQRIQTVHGWRTFVDNKVPISISTSRLHLESTPLLNFYAAITRQDLQSRPTTGWKPKQRLTRDEALRALTMGGAYAGFEEDIKGSIQVGKWADIIMLSKDIMTIPASEILTTEVLATMVGGTVAYINSSYSF